MCARRTRARPLGVRHVASPRRAPPETSPTPAWLPMRGAPRSRGASGRSRARTRAAGATSSTSSAPCTRPGAPPRRRCARSSSASAPTPWSSSSIRSGWTSPWRTRWWPPEGRSTARTCSRARPLRSGSARWSCSATPRRAAARARARISRRPRTSRTRSSPVAVAPVLGQGARRERRRSPPRRTTKASVRETPRAAVRAFRRGARRGPGEAFPLRGPAAVAALALLASAREATAAAAHEQAVRRSPRRPMPPSAWRPRPRTPSRPLTAPVAGRATEILLEARTRFWRPARAGRRRGGDDRARGGAAHASTPTLPRRRRRRGSFRSFPRRFRSARKLREKRLRHAPVLTLRRPLRAGETRRLNLSEPRWLAMTTPPRRRAAATRAARKSRAGSR